MFPIQFNALAQHLNRVVPQLRLVDIFEHQYSENNPSKELRAIPAVFLEFDIESTLRKKNGVQMHTVNMTSHIVSAGLLEAGKRTMRGTAFSHQDIVDSVLRALDRYTACGEYGELKKNSKQQVIREKIPVLCNSSFIDMKNSRKVGANAVSLVTHKALFYTYQNAFSYRGIGDRKLIINDAQGTYTKSE